MSLFAGNVSHRASVGDIRSYFSKFGPCTVDVKRGYAFIDYDDDRDAEDARADTNGKDFYGMRLNVEWSKKHLKRTARLSSSKESLDQRLSRYPDDRRSRDSDRGYTRNRYHSPYDQGPHDRARGRERDYRERERAGELDVERERCADRDTDRDDSRERNRERVGDRNREEDLDRHHRGDRLQRREKENVETFEPSRNGRDWSERYHDPHNMPRSRRYHDSPKHGEQRYYDGKCDNDKLGDIDRRGDRDRRSNRDTWKDYEHNRNIYKSQGRNREIDCDKDCDRTHDAKKNGDIGSGRETELERGRETCRDSEKYSPVEKENNLQPIYNEDQNIHHDEGDHQSEDFPTNIADGNVSRVNKNGEGGPIRKSERSASSDERSEPGAKDKNGTAPKINGVDNRDRFSNRHDVIVNNPAQNPKSNGACEVGNTTSLNQRRRVRGSDSEEEIANVESSYKKQKSGDGNKSRSRYLRRNEGSRYDDSDNSYEERGDGAVMDDHEGNRSRLRS